MSKAKRRWEEWEIEFLRKNYRRLPMSAIMQELSRSRAAIYHKALMEDLTKEQKRRSVYD